MERINILGMSCTGKTSLGRAVADRLGVPHIELDRLYWEADWTPASDDTFRARVADALAAETWVADGGYQMARDIIWSRADTVVWLDYPLRTILPRWARRTIGRIRSGSEFWPGTGNRESLGRALGRDGLLRYILREHAGKRRRTEERLAARPDLHQLRFRSPADASRWLASLG